jgi:Tol biopolymer transport system component
MIAFSSDRGTGFPHQDYPGPAGKWEHVHAASIYIMRADGTGVRQLTTDPMLMAGSPKWSADGRRIVFYELPVRDTFAARVRSSVPSSIVSIELATGERTVHAEGPGLKLSPQFVAKDRVAYLAKSRESAFLAFTSGDDAGFPDDMVNPSWSMDGSRVVYQAGQLATMHHYSRTPGRKLQGWGGHAQFELVYASGFPAISPDGRTLAVSERAPGGDRSALVFWDVDGTNPRRVYRDEGSVMGLEWSRDGRWLAFGSGGFFGRRTSEPARIMIVGADGSESRAVTKGPGNAGFPSWSPDGTEIVYRYWTGEGAQGLRIVDIATGTSRVLTTAYDNLPVWSPKGDRITFTRYAPDERFRYDEFDIYSIRADGTGLERLTDSEGNDAHSAFSPDGNFILWSSSRYGFKDESPLIVNQPQPDAELFIMNADGSEQRALTDNQYEEGTPAWLPPVRLRQ